ncbi:Small nuclear ribonucleoprotein Sm D3 [Porphyridium purpureum]|uniref:Small nuclear ribonucleoprotein Sm D3 n=1 Tax=Porphyridium purpureum TaxID=35688 RepID=A0A5J4YMD3_PORPP|nr:Small nuclear ribonucleoprotein Sm D3 [Porphyridium purpureum]KAA8492305.1 Small nuclear ribonucleoprotein Sm D3 [Porphyridium purpureum]|eukprot:POR2706..scf249_10
MSSRRKKTTPAGAAVLPSLALLLHALRGEVIALELESGALVRGTLVESDAAMNILVERVEFRDPQGVTSRAAMMQIRARQVYFFSLPTDWDVDAELALQVRQHVTGAAEGL